MQVSNITLVQTRLHSMPYVELYRGTFNIQLPVS